MKHVELDEGKQLPDWRIVLERHGGQVELVENAQLIPKQYAPEKEPRDPEHRHDYGQNPMPVLSFDLHKTLTPDWGYPLVSPPFEGVKAFLDRMAGRGCCIHICSASLDNPDPDFTTARTNMVDAWVRQNGLPVSWIGPNTEASLRVDDRGVTIPPAPDWVKALPAEFESRLDKTYELDENGLYRRRDDLEPVGTPIGEDNYPDDGDVPQDAPRGLSTPLIDFDMHRTIMPAWGTKRDAAPNPGMVDLIRRLYAEGFSIQISCGGWNPATVDDPQFGVDRAAWQRRYLRQWGIPYDRLVTKDDCDTWGDDKVVGYDGSAGKIETAIRARLGPAVPWSSNNPINEPDAPIKAVDPLAATRARIAELRLETT